jgi:hypothetical protein
MTLLAALSRTDCALWASGTKLPDARAAGPLFQTAIFTWLRASELRRRNS